MGRLRAVQSGPPASGGAVDSVRVQAGHAGMARQGADLLVAGTARDLGPEHQRAFKAVAGDLLVELGYETGLDW